MKPINNVYITFEKMKRKSTQKRSSVENVFFFSKNEIN